MSAARLVVAAAVHRGRPLHLSGAERAGTAAALAVLGLATAALGRHGWRRGATLLPPTTAPSQVAHRSAVLRRGAAACVVVGLAVLAAAGVVAAG